MKTMVLAGALLALSAPTALAQTGQAARMDANGDGRVSLTEFRSARGAMMMRADANKDGRLTKAELEAGMAAMRPGGGAAKGPGPGGMFGMMDANHDGFLSRPEIDRMLERRFQRIDVDRDGSLSAGEVAAMRGGGAR
jgi:Ca2+-binding EF-hand superfamily protein